MLCHENAIYNGKRISQFLTGTKETNHINFCKITYTLSASPQPDQPVLFGRRSSISYIECVVKTVVKTVQADLNLH